MDKRDWTQKLEEKIKKYCVISFDIFDTLLKRDCLKPEDIFAATEERYNYFYGEKIDFAKKRYIAEVGLYKRGNLTPSMKEIYDNISLDEEKKRRLMDIEEQMEMEFACANQPIFKVYKKCREMGKTIFAISDMYLSQEVLIKMLKKCGYEVENIFVSNEERANKVSGELFEKFLTKTGIPKEKVLHIGDNVLADINGAKKVGIETFHVPGIVNNTAYYQLKHRAVTWEDHFLYPFVNNHILFMENRRSQIGFETLGPVVYGFCQWLYRMKEKYKIDKLLFCARDVYQTMEIYKKIYPEERENVGYLCVSLKSLKTPYEAACGRDQSAEAMEQLCLIRKYFEQLGCKGKVAMVDSGCGGHTQHMITTILDNMCEFHGLYMRISKNFTKNVNDKESFPYMFSSKPSAKSYISGAFFETMLSATHGRTLCYAYNESGKVVPVFGENNPKADIITEFQSGIYAFAEMWQSRDENRHVIASESIQNAFLNLSFFPLEGDVDLLSKITGGNEEYFDIVSQSADGRSKEWKLFFKNLKNTYWKGGYLCKFFKHYKLICKIYLFFDEKILNMIGF